MQPQSPNRNFDFILQNDQKSKRRLPLPQLPKPAKIILAAVAGLLVLIIVVSVFSSHRTNANQPILNAMYRQQEILRVTQLARQQLQFQDPNTQALAATTYSTLSSEQQQLIGYLAGNGTKVSASSLGADQNKSTDAQLQSASHNNNLDSAYISYLKQALNTYQTDLQTAYKSAGTNGKTILNNAYDSAKTLLSSAPLKS